MTADVETRSAYERWLGGAHTAAHARRTAARNASFLLPHLRTGMRLLDTGCGPGSITLGLAEAVAPGEVVGIDVSASAIEHARTLASGRGVTNVGFEVADVCDLPFEDTSFDAGFMHAVLQHLPDPLRAVRDIHRVLRPGGVLGLADADHDASVLYPDEDGRIARGHEIMREMRRRASGGDVYVGRRLRSLLHEAAFVRVEATVMAHCEGTSEATRRTAEWWASYISAPPFVAHATALGLCDERELEDIATAWRGWGAHPAATWATMWFQAVGCVP
jgi:ubiquinone/menaquinone biosynthesis C-methylase UbiE